MSTKIIKVNPKTLKNGIDNTIRVDHINQAEIKPNISIDLTTIDSEIKAHIEKVIRPQIQVSDSVTYVPVIFVSPEKWYSMSELGYIRDTNDMILNPLIALYRTSIDYRDDYLKNNITKTSENRILYEKQYSPKNKYAQFNLLNNVEPIKEYYSVELPRHIQITYQLTVWCDLMEQLNGLIQQIMYFHGTAFGEKYKLVTMIDAPQLETTNNVGETRMVKAIFNLRTKAYILNADDRSRPIVQKLVGINKVIISFNETNFTTSDPIISTPNSATNFIDVGKSEPYISTVMTEELFIYINTNVNKVATVQNSTSAVILNTNILIAPSILSSTNVNSFYYFINGQNIPASYVTSITQVNASVVIVFDTILLGYTLSSTDVIVVVGKFKV